MARGDQIYVMRPFAGMSGVYEHHGIDCGDGTVIHYRKPDDRPATISRSSLSDFSWGKRIYVKRYEVSLISGDVIARAESRLGEQQYDLFNNNCEHFATWCKTGYNESSQLAQFGVDGLGFSLSDSRQLMQDALQENPPERAHTLFNRALGNIEVARRPLVAQLTALTKDMQTWHRVAQVALQQDKEAVARAALEKKVQAKRQIADLEKRLLELSELERDLLQNLAIAQAQ